MGSSESSGAEDAEEEDDVESLRSKLAETRSDRLRLLAEMENVREIARRDVSRSREYAISKFAKEMLEVADSLTRARDAVDSALVQGVKGDELLPQLIQGVEATQVQLKYVFEGHGIVSFGAHGDKFDPHYHNALFSMPATEGLQAGHIGRVVKAGYIIKDRVLRP